MAKRTSITTAMYPNRPPLSHWRLKKSAAAILDRLQRSRVLAIILGQSKAQSISIGFKRATMVDKPFLASALTLSLSFILAIFASCLNCQSESQLTVDRNGTRLFPLARNYLAKGKPEAAQNLLETFLELYPNDPEAHLYLGEAYASEKNYPKACFQFTHCLRVKDRLDIAAEANRQLLKLPRRWIRPRKVGCLASASPEAPRASQCLLVFFAQWDVDSLKLKSLAESAKNQSGNLTIKTLCVGDPTCTQIFDLYNVSAIPTVVVLSGGKQNIIASMVGPISENSLRNLITSHRNL